MRTFLWLAVVALLVATCVVEKSTPRHPPPVSLTEVAALVPPTWQYGTSKDKMDGSESSYASIDSRNVLEFAFPYNAKDNRATLTLWKRNSKFNGTVLRVKNGQFLCRRDECFLRVKFDDENPKMYPASPRGDGAYDVVNIAAGNEFLAKLKKSKRLLIEAVFYQEALRIIEFDVTGLVWP